MVVAYEGTVYINEYNNTTKYQVFTGVASPDMPDTYCNHFEVADNINNLKINFVIEFEWARTEGILLFNPEEEKHRYVCVLIQENLHTLFSYESFNKRKGTFSKFVPPHETIVKQFLADSLDY